MSTTSDGQPGLRTETRTGVCNLCEAICGLSLTITRGPDGPDVTGIRGNPADPLSRGHICPKGVAMADLWRDPDRLTRPVRRIGSGADARWEEISWKEANRLVTEGLARAQAQHGDDAVAVYLGNPNAHSLGSMTHGSALVKTLRTRNRFSATSVDQLPHQLLAYWMFGHQLLLPIPDVDRTSYFLVLGGNPMASNGSLMTVPDFPARMRALKTRGGRLVVLDPRRTETAKVADEHHFIRPGSDAFVLLAMVRTLVDDGTAVPPDYAKGFDQVVGALEPFTAERAEQMSGISAEEIRRLAREYAAADSAAAYCRIGVSAGEFGSLGVWGVTLLNALTGNLDRVGGAMFTSPAIDVVGSGLVGRGHWDQWRSRVRDLPEALGELPVSALREEMATPGEGQVRALLTIAGNPVLSTPDGVGLERAIEGLDFMAAIDIYVNETTRHADVILPPTTALERDHYDLVFQALAVRNTTRFTPAVFDKRPDQRHDWQVFRDLALSLARRRGMRGKARAMLEARMRTSPTLMVRALLRRGSGLTMRALRDRPQGVDLGPLRADLLPTRLQTKDGMLDLAPPVVLADLARLDAAAAPDDDTLVLIGRRHQRDCNSWLHNTERLTRGRARHQLFIHPQDLAVRDLADGASVTVTSRVGSVRVEAAANADMMRGVVSLPHGYGHQREGVLLQRATEVEGVSPNDLTDPTLLDVSGNAALNGVPVTVTS